MCAWAFYLSAGVCNVSFEFQAGGPFYPLYTGRKDSKASFLVEASSELPSPQDDLSTTIHSFASKGFDERETVSLLGTSFCSYSCLNKEMRIIWPRIWGCQHLKILHIVLEL